MRDPLGKEAVAKRGETYGLAANDGFDSGERQRLRSRRHVPGRGDAAELGLRGAIGGGLGEAADVDRPELGQRLEHVVRADLVAAVGRERHAVREEQHAAHARP